MRIPIHTVLTDLEGEPLIRAPEKRLEGDVKVPAKVWTLGFAIAEALSSEYPELKDGKPVMTPAGPQMEHLNIEDREKRYTLAKAMMNTKAPEEPDISAEELVLIRRLVALRYSTLVAGQSLLLLKF